VKRYKSDGQSEITFENYYRLCLTGGHVKSYAQKLAKRPLFKEKAPHSNPMNAKMPDAPHYFSEKGRYICLNSQLPFPV